MACRSLGILGLGILVVGAACAAALALDPRRPGYEFTYTLYPPSGFSVKKSKAVPRPDPKDPKAFPIIGQDGKFTDLGQWYYAIGSDPKNFEKWWYGYWSDAKNWTPCKTPVFTGTAPGNLGHRIIAWLGNLKGMVDADAEIAPAVKQALCSEAWKRAAEQTIIGTINEKGMLEYGGNKADMACVFHFIRTKFGAIGLRVDSLYTIGRAQDLICTLLTEPWIICEEDKYLDPPDRDYLEGIGKQYAGRDSNIRIVQGGKILYTGASSSAGGTSRRSTEPGTASPSSTRCSSITRTPTRPAPSPSSTSGTGCRRRRSRSAKR
ncbi:MAG: hypothetical protein NTX87_05010 [Planctomycetota bacterium]|nr:hypothetical protein [Planctomycetota bacterium]